MKNVCFVFALIVSISFTSFAEAGACHKKEKACCEVKCCDDVCCRSTLAERVAEKRAERACERAERVACRAERRAARNCCKPTCCDPCSGATVATPAVARDSFAEAVANSTPCCGN